MAALNDPVALTKRITFFRRFKKKKVLFSWRTENIITHRAVHNQKRKDSSKNYVITILCYFKMKNEEEHEL